MSLLNWIVFAIISGTLGAIVGYFVYKIKHKRYEKKIRNNIKEKMQNQTYKLKIKEENFKEGFSKSLRSKSVPVQKPKEKVLGKKSKKKIKLSRSYKKKNG